MDWTNDIILDFLECYENEPIIWNSSTPNHKNRNEIHDAWKRIEHSMGQKYSVTELKKKKDSLMASFRNCRNKAKRHYENAGEDYKPQWFAYEKMASFLCDRDLPRTTRNNSEDSSNSDDESETITADIIPKIEWDDDTEHEALALSSHSRSSYLPPEKKRRVTEPQEQVDNTDNAHSIKPGPTDEERHLCRVYGELVAAKLLLMDEQTRDTCMHRVDNLLFDIKMKIKKF